MPLSNPEYLSALHRLTAIAIKLDRAYQCDELVALNDRALGSLPALPSAPTRLPASAAAPRAVRGRPRKAVAAPPAAATAPTFDEAVLAAVTSSPAGVDAADLRPILAHYNRPPNQIGAALVRLKRQAKIVQRADKWHATAAGRKAANPKGANNGGKIDRTMPTRRTRRNSAAGQAPAEAQPALAVAGAGAAD